MPSLCLEERGQWMVCLELSSPSPEPNWCTVPNLIWLLKHRFNVFDLSVFLSSFFFLSCSLLLLSPLHLFQFCFS